MGDPICANCGESVLKCQGFCRNYLDEAYRIAAGDVRLPELKHIQALIKHLDRIQAAIENLMKVSK